MYSLVVATVMMTSTASPTWHHHGCHGCHGCGCYGWGGYGCGCYGCGCYGWGCYGCGCYGWAGYGCGCYGCYGCGCYGCYGYGYAAAPVVAVPAYAAAPVYGETYIARTPTVISPTPTPTTARVTIMVPEGARVFVNDNIPVDVTPADRTFKTPALEPGKKYYYVFKTEMERDGKVVRASQQVEVVAGRDVTVKFDAAPAAAAARR